MFFHGLRDLVFANQSNFILCFLWLILPFIPLYQYWVDWFCGRSLNPSENTLSHPSLLLLPWMTLTHRATWVTAAFPPESHSNVTFFDHPDLAPNNLPDISLSFASFHVKVNSTRVAICLVEWYITSVENPLAYRGGQVTFAKWSNSRGSIKRLM